ncbi:hypothetical protein DC366_04520 [Pelagivirga sediminicola]|uniref:Uncharacterized protein n=1 Tax=Pelagivirga sediminicola TaxID=2170575 RepID=A0A2T7G9E2_9RHOB|nr:hypothetical protein [Pelagivirga sediminicola]PVA11042.1 hypothetical protein DC366_04520 [Pelagivirga sediminicola]
MSRPEALRRALVLPPGGLPAILADLQLRVVYTPDAIARGVPARVANEVERTLEAAIPLFAAGFCGAANAAPNAAARLSGAVTVTKTGFVLSVTGAAHALVFAAVLSRVIEAHSQTPDGAFAGLVDLLDGDEAEARAVFSALSFAEDVERIEITGAGTEQVTAPFDPMARPARATLDGLAGAIPADAERLIFEGAAFDGWTEAIDDGFLTLFGLGLFAAPGPVPSEPEIFLADGRLVVDGWKGDPAWLAELLDVVTGGRGALLRVEPDADAP